MQDRVLIAFATRYGGTAEIAERIGAVIGQAGLPADVLPVGSVRNLDSYRAIVLGSGVYIGRWRKDAVKFLKANERLLSERPVWLFSSGPTGDGDPVDLLSGWRVPTAQQPLVDRIHPRDIAVFHGVVDAKKLNPLHKWMIKKVDSPVGDFRDWDAIASWAASIATEIMES